MILFLGTNCPVSIAYIPRIQQLSKRYANEIAFVGIFSHASDDAESIAKFGKQFALNFPLLPDSGTTIADQFAVQRVPTAVVLDATRSVRYFGRIDDQFTPQVHRSRATTRELAAAIESILDNTPLKTAHTEAAGCKLTRETTVATVESPITYHKHVLPILQAKCQECHRPGEAAPFTLMSYKSAKSWSAMMREVVADNIMPPWHADAKPGHFRNDRRLSEEEKATLLKWIDQGCVEGVAADAPAPRQYLDGWRLPRKPDMVLKMKQSVNIPANSLIGVDYQYIDVGTPFAEDTWVEAVEVRPDYRAVVHHIICFILPPGQGLEALRDDNFGAFMLGAYVPGDMPAILPNGHARKIAKGSQLVFEMHYTPNGQAGRDQSMVGICTSKTPPKHEVFNHAIMNGRFRIPPGDPNHEVRSKFTFDKPSEIISLAPHMHVRGKAFRYELVKPNGDREVLLNVPKYDFNWQVTYELSKPLRVDAGSRIECFAWFDNSDKNPTNPNPNATVRWGNQTWEEMMIGFVTYTGNEIMKVYKKVARNCIMFIFYLET